MKAKRFTTGLAILLAALAGISVPAFAAGLGDNDATAVLAAKIRLAQAVTAAEQHVGGKASRAEYEPTAKGAAYDVEVVRGGKVFDVRVDSDSGKVIASAEDQGDRDDEHDRID